MIVDGGTSGVATFDICRRAIIDHPMVRTKVLAFIDPNQLYLATGDFICHKLEIANDLRNLDEASLVDSLERNADIAPCVITCGIYGWMVHTRFFGTEDEGIVEYDKMKASLSRIVEQLSDAKHDEGRAIEAMEAFVETYP